jgi:hypothetical protein
MIRRRSYWLAVLPAVLCAGALYAQQYPVMNMMADRIIQKYQSSSCETLWQKKQQPKSDEEQNLIHLLQGDPDMRAAFINKIAAPIANKMFECAMIP